MANETPPWAAYRGTKNCRLTALDKRPGVRSVGIASVWDRTACKLTLSPTGLNAKAACGSKQLCAGLDAGIESAVQAVLEQSTADGGMRFGEEKTDATAPAQPAATVDDGAMDGIDTENWTAEDWTRLFT